MADFSRARRTMEASDIIDRLKTLHDLEDARDIPDEETKTVLKEAAVHIGLWHDQARLNDDLAKSAIAHANVYKSIALSASQDPNYKRAATQLALVEMYADQLRTSVNTFQRVMDEAGLLSGPEGRKAYEIIMKHLQHDLAGVKGMSIRYNVRAAVEALRGLPVKEPGA